MGVGGSGAGSVWEVKGWGKGRGRDGMGWMGWDGMDLRVALGIEHLRC